jgi:imidazole glycerol phosphate synthase subunit HisF
VNEDLVRQRLIAALESVPLVWAPYSNPIQHLFDAHTQKFADAVLAAGFVFQEASVAPPRGAQR